MTSEVEEAFQECRNAEEKAKKAITDVSDTAISISSSPSTALWDILEYCKTNEQLKGN